MRIQYDEAADAAFIWFVDGGPQQVERTEPADVSLENAAIVFMWDRSDRLLGLEVLGASKVMPNGALDPSDG